MTGKSDSHTDRELSKVVFSQQGRCEQTNLDGRYGEIGILAVAAAVRYMGASKNPAYAPVVPRIDLRLAEFAV